MKTQLVKIATAVLAITLLSTGSSIAKDPDSFYDKKDTKVIRVYGPIMKIFTEDLNLSADDIQRIAEKLEEVSNLRITLNENLEIYVEEGAFEWMPNNENWVSSQLEDWMFEDFSPEEADPVLEDWMFEDNYFDSEEAPEIEAWMLEDDYYSSEYDNQLLEPWMFDTDYYEDIDAPVIMEDWMFEAFQPAEETSQLEDWMFDVDYYDDNNQIEDWMLDTEYWSED